MTEYITVWRGSMGSLRPVTDARLEPPPPDPWRFVGRFVSPEAARQRRSRAARKDERPDTTSPAGPPRGKDRPVTWRERRRMRQLRASGLSLEQIGAEVNRRPETVSRHLARRGR